MDIKFPYRSSYEYLCTGHSPSYMSIRLRYHITSANYAIPGLNKSLMHWCTIEWGGLTRNTHRVRY